MNEKTRSTKVISRTITGILWLLVLTSLLVTFGTNSKNNKPSNSSQVVEVKPFEVESEGVELVARDVADFSLTERSEETVTNQDLLGKPWVVNFIFTSCAMTCPANTTAMMELSQACQDLDVRFVTITVDPERDTPKRLREYAEIYQADPEKWLFLTGEKDEIFDLIKYSFLQIIEERTGKDRLFGYEFAHTDRVIHINSKGRIIGQYLSTDPKEMIILRRVLAGKMEIPTKNQFLFPKDLPSKPDKKNQVKPDDENAKKETNKTEVSVTAKENSEKRPAQESIKKNNKPAVAIPAWLSRLPAINAILNSIATLLLILGYILIRQDKKTAHKKTMLLAFVVSIAFLGCYLTYHWGLQQYTGESSRKFPEIGFLRQVYLSILLSHILLAASVPFLSVGTIYLGLTSQWNRHRFWAQITFPIWLYVSITGVIIYVMLYHIAAI